MSLIKTLQQQQAQVGRIRIGQQVEAQTKNGKRIMRPEKLDRFRFTTPSQQLALAVAARYGGQPQPWQPDGRPQEWEVVSDVRSLPVLVPPRPVTQFYEMWSGAGCLRRCDGEVETISGEPCKCPLDVTERGDLAAKGQACKATTRLKVMLPEIPGLGVWRLDSHGFYAAIELPSTAEFLGAVTDAGGYVRATLTIEARQVKRPGVGVRGFFVPALHVDVTPEQLIAGAGTALTTRATQAIESGTAPVSQPSGSAGEQSALPAGCEGQREQAQALLQLVEGASTRDELAAIYEQARVGGLLTTVVADDAAVERQLGEFIIAKGSAVTQIAANESDDEYLRGLTSEQSVAAS